MIINVKHWSCEFFMSTDMFTLWLRNRHNVFLCSKFLSPGSALGHFSQPHLSIFITYGV